MNGFIQKEEVESSNWSELIAGMTGVVSAALGLVVFYGWYTHNASLIKVLPTFTPMPLNAAFCFLLCGLSLFALPSSRHAVTIVCGIPVALVSFLTLVQWISGLNFGIDEFFMRNYIVVEPVYPGRMIPNTALCFFLSAMALVAIGTNVLSKTRLVVSGVLGSIVIGVSLVTLLGYLFGVETVYRWKILAPMSLHSALGFIFIGMGLIFTSWKKENIYIPVIFTLFVGLIFSLFVLGVLLNLERENLKARFMRDAISCVSTVQREMASDLEAMHSLAAFYDNSDVVDRKRFRSFAHSIFKDHRRIRALSWVPKILHSERENFEGKIRAEGYADFQILEMNTQGNLVKAGVRDVYFPICFIEPHGGNEIVLGFDRGSDAIRLEALESARDAGEITITRPVLLASEEYTKYSIITSIPIYRKGDREESVEWRRENLVGFVSGSFRIEDIFDEAFSYSKPAGMHISLIDQTTAGERILLYQSSDSGEGIGQIAPEKGAGFPGMYYAIRLNVAGRDWLLMCRPTLSYFERNKGWILWLAFFGALLFTLLLSIYLWFNISYTRRVETQVALRTEELSKAKQALEQEIEVRKRSEEETRHYAEELKRSNRELEHFAYVASHDLQEPLRTVASFGQLLEKCSNGKLDSDARKYIGFIIESARRMQVLINDLLAYSRVGTRAKPFEPVDSNEVLELVMRNLKAALEESHAVVEHGRLPMVFADATQLLQVFQNLISNAVKFRDPNAPPKVEIGVEQQNGRCVFSVRDNGIGFDPRYKDQIFVIFQRLHSREEYPGTGIGLALTKKIVERHGGHIWVESQPGKGSVFYFSLPLAKADSTFAAL